MCGISGIISRSKFDGKLVEAMCNAIKHRGPDDEGYIILSDSESKMIPYGGNDTPKEAYTSNTSYKPTQSITEADALLTTLAFGHRRLSIIDLSPAGHLPMLDSTNRYWITYNGEIYNYLELREELQKEGHVFKTETDTEVILAAYSQWGIDCQHKFIGMWAFAIYDTKEKNVFLSRDRFGIKPLYYWMPTEDTFCFGSEIKEFMVHPNWESLLNGQRAYDFLLYSLSDHTDETLFKGVYQIPPGHYIFEKAASFTKDSSGRVKTNSWYTIAVEPSPLTFKEAVADFKKIFYQSIALHLRSDVAVGSALSGGLDSSSIVCVINELLAKQGIKGMQNTFSSVAEDTRYSEKVWVDEVIKVIDVKSNFIYPKGEAVFTLTDKILWHHDEPYQSQSAFLAYHVFERVAHEKVKVLLNGQGADEYLSAYGSFQSLRLQNDIKNFRFIKINRELTVLGYSTISKSLFYLKNIGLMLPEKLKFFIAQQKTSYKRILNLIDTDKLGANKSHPYLGRKTKTAVAIASKQLLNNPLQAYLHWEDRNSMAHSVEARVPFLDYRLVEFALSLPIDYLDGPKMSKKLLVNAMKGVLPEVIRLRADKKGFISPEERWLKEDYTNEYRELMKEAIENSNGLIKPSALQFFDDVVSDKIPFDYTYWRLLLFARWLKLFNVKAK